MNENKFNSEEFENFLQSIPDLICKANFDGYFTYLNNQWVKTLGYSLEEFYSKPYIEFIHPEDRERTINEAKESLTENGSSLKEFRNRYIHKNGSIIWLEWSVTLHNETITAIARNITEEMNKSRANDDISRIGNIGFWRYDILNDELFWSEETYRIHELDPKIKLNLNLAKSFYKEDSQEIITDAINKAIQKGIAWDLELPLTTTKNHSIWARLKGEVIKVNDKPVQIVGVFQDITEKKLVEKQLQDQQLKVLNNAKLASLGEMAGGIAHEINNPLAIINGFSERLISLIDENILDEDKLRTCAERIHKTVQRISSIVISLKKFSRDASQDPLEKINIGTVISDSLEFSKERIEKKGIKVIIEKENSDELIFTKPVELSQVIINLLNNAHDEITQKDFDEKWIKIETRKTGKFVDLVITDSGKGIPKPLANKIMQPFFTTKGVGKGTGLGLSISKSIIEKHHGRFFIDFESTNTSFVVRLPNAKFFQESDLNNINEAA